MTEVIAPVELPTGRRSYMHSTPTTNQDIHDPNWIPVLDGVDFKTSGPSLEKELSPYSTASFSPFPIRTASPKRRLSLSRDRSNDSPGPVSVLSELDVNLPPKSSSGASKTKYTVFKNTSPQKRRKSIDATSSDGQETAGSETSTEDGVTPNTMTSNNFLEENYFTLPDQPVPREEIQPPCLPLTNRASAVSNKKLSTVMPPTSKYNRKAVNSIITTSARPPTLPSQSNTPRESPGLSPVANIDQPPVPSMSQLSLPQLPPVEPLTQLEFTPKVISTKSSASDKRQRALQSHPSNLSLQGRSRPSSISEDIEILPKPPSIRHKPRKSTESRPNTPRSFYESQTPVPAPTTPLPELPPQARRPSTKEGTHLKPLQIPAEAHLTSPPIPTFTPAEHTEMASFMTNTNTIIFRRFDDVHVRLLLGLQDEITQLERELLRIERPTTPSGDQTLQRTRVLRDLRKVVSEYDHLFANWSQMQANKASKSIIRDLKQWLERPNTGTTAGLAKGAKDDLEWLEKSKDLSTVKLGSREDAPPADGIKSSVFGLDGFWDLLNCAGRRK